MDGPILANYTLLESSRGALQFDVGPEGGLFHVNPRTALKIPNFEFGPPPTKKAGSAPAFDTSTFQRSCVKLVQLYREFA